MPRATICLLAAALVGCESTAPTPFVNLGGIYSGAIQRADHSWTTLQLELDDATPDPVVWDVGRLRTVSGGAVHDPVIATDFEITYRATADSVFFRWEGVARIPDAARAAGGLTNDSVALAPGAVLP